MQFFAPSRRQVVQGLIGVAATALPIPAGAAADPSLKALARQKGILFGSAFSSARLGLFPGTPPDPLYRDLVAQQCAVIVAESEFKQRAIARLPGRPDDFTRADALVAFARKSGLRMRGHTLLWSHPKGLPDWQLTYDFGSRADTERYLRDYVGRVCDHFGGFIHSWDVINEAIDPANGASRPTPFNRILGDDSLDICFRAARAHAPHAQLVYNDYMSWGAFSRAHRAGVLRLLEGFRKRKVPVDALGIQSHVVADPSAPPDWREWTMFLDQVVGMGYRLLITELDIRDTNLSADITARDAGVADATRNYLDHMLSYRQLDQLLCWGLADEYSWLRVDDVGKRRDGQPMRPDPYDDDLQPKPMRAAIAAALQAAPRR